MNRTIKWALIASIVFFAGCGSEPAQDFVLDAGTVNEIDAAMDNLSEAVSAWLSATDELERVDVTDDDAFTDSWNGAIHAMDAMEHPLAEWQAAFGRLDIERLPEADAMRWLAFNADMTAYFPTDGDSPWLDRMITVRDRRNLAIVAGSWVRPDCGSTLYFERTPLIGVWTIRGPRLLGDEPITVRRFDLEGGGDVNGALVALHRETGVTRVSFPDALGLAGLCDP